MSMTFDASLIDNEPIADAVHALHRVEVEGCMTMPSAMANAKLHAENELRRLIALCNRIAWGTGAAVPEGIPDPAGISALLERLSGEDRDRLLCEAKAAKAQRALVSELVQADALLHARMETEEAERARLEAERLAWEEFEVLDREQKNARFEAWRASRNN